MRLRIGEVKKILGVSAETLRFFDKKGVVVPTRHPDNNYRTYEGRDVNRIVRYKYLRRLDFSLEESVDFISEISSQEALEMMSQQEMAVAAKIREYQEVLQQLAYQKDLYQRIITMVGKYQREVLPAYRFYANQMDRVFETRAMQNDHTRQWIDEMPRSVVAFHIPREKIDVPGCIYWGYAILDITGDHEDRAPHLPVTVCHKAQDTVFTVIYCIDEDLTIPERFQPLKDYLKAEGLQIDGDLFGTVVHHQVIDEKPHLHFAVWVPVKEVPCQ
ncbi:MerR family transcriptional regulator [Anoxynatronum buryatiense]|uniref:DNA-binding transcriptional regulator, MerR family n=1 Tax=Anoxynatronum buryatiense TaxID=489973 RepID=A0AA45WXW0_9CLOT|nr:MerR family transcriptional regulator [Anoxynatronum buryatiense]SMP66130.1 DNA-binding transcriptional regulator, MerR family [Anoxynatronum buryatiense]